MDIQNSIQFIDFESNIRTNNVASKPNEGIIYRRSGTNKSYQMRLPFIVNEAVEKGYEFIRVAVNHLTNETFIVFDKGKGVKIQIKNYGGKNSSIIVMNRKLIEWIESRFNLSKSGGSVITFSDNLDRVNGYTFRLTAKNN